MMLPPQGGGLTASEPEGATAQYGPAVVFQSGPMHVSAQGTTGPTGSVTSSARVVGYQDDTDPDGDGPGPFLYQDVRSSCAAATGVTATATIASGIVETKYDPNTQEPIESQEVPEHPPPGYTVEGTLDHVGDSFRIVFNEQVTNPDGSLTVNAAHLYLLGPIAIGDVIIGQSICGVRPRPPQP
ncbi:MAG TPA: hypothetical protein VG452_09470 [Egibacteraceae bacterium]|nr:hypothetical protein [Egibacteraceae bacterium]